MANIASQIKRNRQNEKRRLRNRNYRGSARSAVKGALSSMAAGKDSAEATLAAISTLDRAAQKGAIHHRNAARRKGRLMKRLAALQATGVIKPAVEEKPAPATASRVEKPKAEPKKAAAKAEKKPEAKKTAAKKTTKK